MESVTETARVLYVDDDPAFTEMIATVLEREEGVLEVTTAKDAETGLEIVREGSVDCIVSDYSMPETDGLEFLRAVREENEQLPFLLLTGRGSEDIASEAISAGVTDYLQKQQGTEHYSLLANRVTNAVEQYRAQQELEERTRELERLKDRFQSFVKHSPDVITAIEADGTITYQSPAIERVLGYEPDEMIGENVLGYVHPEDEDRVKSWFDSVLESDEEGLVTKEYRFRRADGTWIWIESITSADGVDAESDYIINSRDVTERKRRERELEQKSERLEEFAGIVSHDLQTPITVADARLEMAQRECDSEHLGAIGEALDRMEEIIDGTLTLAREGRVVDETEPVELAELAAECFVTVATPEATFECVNEPTIRADRERLKRVLENLIANAIDHGDADVTVEIGELETEAETGFYVEDDGPGIPGDEREAIFEAGYSLSESGTGFGLAIVEEIVDAHGWSIEVTDDDGARFEVTGVDLL